MVAFDKTPFSFILSEGMYIAADPKLTSCRSTGLANGRCRALFLSSGRVRGIKLSRGNSGPGQATWVWGTDESSQ